MQNGDPQAAFITTGGEQAVFNAYDAATRQQLMRKLNFLPPIYSKETLLAPPRRYAQVEYLFSTWGMLPLTAAEIRTLLPSLKAVFYAAGSVQAFARPFLDEGVTVLSAWAANAVPVAEYAFAQILLAGKGFFRLAPAYKQGQQAQAAPLKAAVHGNYGLRVGLLGAGMIGKMVIERLRSTDNALFVYDPFLSEKDAAALGVTKLPMDELFATCAVVSNHIADLPQTKGIFTHEHFMSMPQNAVFINTGRGAQLDADGFIRAMRQRPDITALLDVTDPCEPLPAGHPLLDLPNVLITPHIAGSMGAEVARMGAYMLKEFNALSSGAPLKYAVTSEMLKTMA